MLSEKQLAANRANAQKLTGPKTEAGKERTRLNAWRHGLSAQVWIMNEPDREAMLKFTTEIVESLQPFDAHERQLAQSLAVYYWRINRCAAMEESMLSLGLAEETAENYQIENPEAHNAASHAQTFRNDSEAFNRLSIYNQRLVNQAEKTRKQLEHIQSERKKREEQEMPMAIIIYKNFKKAGGIFNPRQNGFDLTVPQIEACIHRMELKDYAYVAETVRRAA